MTSKWPLQLHSDFCDLVTIVVKTHNSCFFDQLKNP
jgi:hypothetical protein